MIKTPTNLQDLRRRIYIKAKTENSWRFWGLYVHICKKETLLEAYRLARSNKGAPGYDGVTFDGIESKGLDSFIEQIKGELESGSYIPMPNRKKEIPKGTTGKTRVLSIPSIRDRVVQGAIKLILEPIFEADFQEGSFGFRPKRSPHQAIKRVEKAIVQEKTRVIDVDLKSYFDTIRHDILLTKISARVNDDKVMRLIKAVLQSSGKVGVPQGGPLSPRTQLTQSHLTC